MGHPCCDITDVLFIEINNKIKDNFINNFFPVIITQQRRGFTTKL